jgi:hypothetical protein
MTDVRHVARRGYKKIHTNFLVVKPEGKNYFEERNRYNDNIKKSSEVMGLQGVDSIHVAQDRDQWRALAAGAYSNQIVLGDKMRIFLSRTSQIYGD